MIFDILDVNPNLKIVVLYWTFEMPGYQQIMRSASKDMKKQLGELYSLEKPLSTKDFNHYEDNAKKYPISVNNVIRSLKSNVIHSNLTIGELRELAIWTDVTMETIDWKFGENIYNK